MRTMHQVLPTKVNPDTAELAVFIEGALAIKQDNYDSKYPAREIPGGISALSGQPYGGYNTRIVYSLLLDWAPKFAKVWCWEARDNGKEEPKCSYIYAFIDRMTGDVLKPASTKAPAKHARSNIFDETNGLSGVNWYGPVYLR